MRQFLFLATIILLLNGCTTKLAYNYMDWVIQWKVRSFISLSSAQKQQTKHAAKNFHQWHQSSQLPQYAAYLQTVKQRLSQGSISALEIQTEVYNTQELLNQSLKQITPDIINLIITLDDSQTTQLLGSYQKQREEYTLEYANISLNNQEKNRYKDMIKTLTPWLGSLSQQQKKQIAQWSQNLKPYEKLNVEQQKQWEQQLYKILDQRDNQLALSKAVEKLLFSSSDDWAPDIANTFAYNQNLTYSLFSDIANNLSKKQKQVLFNKIDDYIEICLDLSNNTQQKN